MTSACHCRVPNATGIHTVVIERAATSWVSSSRTRADRNARDALTSIGNRGWAQCRSMKRKSVCESASQIFRSKYNSEKEAICALPRFRFARCPVWALENATDKRVRAVSSNNGERSMRISNPNRANDVAQLHGPHDPGRECRSAEEAR